MEDSNLPIDNIHPFNNSKIPPWGLIKHEVDISLSEFENKETNPLVFKQKLAEIKQCKHPAIEIYTDGSKDKNKVAAAVVINHDIFLVRLPNEATIFTIETKTNPLASEHIECSKDT